ncbi:MAG: hypothetical protein ASARMPREDX12_003566 [Alectoria sarmentosa]|nr:MAG: hypothetical protein ASARMPREDX12_003566 [Alectoria sarmentosa]
MRAKLPTALTTPLSRTLTHPLPPCRLHLQNPTSSSSSFKRTLSSTPALLRKGANGGKQDISGKQDSKRAVALNGSKAQVHFEPHDPFDLSDYSAAIARAHAHLKSELGKIKAGGSNADEIEGLRVVLGKREGGEKEKEKDKDKGGEKGKGKGKAERERERERESVTLGDVASVVARGRNVGVLVGEKDHLKPVLSSLASLPSLSYTTSPTDPLTLTVAVPPVTAESRLAAKKVAEKKGEEALFALREARGAQRKRHRSMELGRLVGPDDLRKAEKEVERTERAVN